MATIWSFKENFACRYLRGIAEAMIYPFTKSLTQYEDQNQTALLT